MYSSSRWCMLIKPSHQTDEWVSSYWWQCSLSHRGHSERRFASVNTVILNHQSIDEKQLCRLMSLPPSQASIYERASPGQSFNEPLSYSIRVSCKGWLIRAGHEASHTTSTGRTSGPLNYQLSPVLGAAATLQAHWESLVRLNKSCSSIYWQLHN